jgi:S-adenosylmethionine-dependent methyltransferase
MSTHASTTYFEKSGQGFIDGIYGNQLGALRQEQLLEDLEAFLSNGKDIARILDIGAGHAPVTLALLSKHAELSAVLVEPSEQLLKSSEELQSTLSIPGHRVQRVRCELSAYMESVSGVQADLMLCHAVANWTQDPEMFLADLLRLAKRSVQYVSLVVGASRGKAVRFAHQGNMADLLGTLRTPGSSVQSFAQKETVRPLDPDWVMSLIERSGCTIVKASGVRIFADYVPSAILSDSDTLQELKEAERLARHHAHYWKLGQLIHLLFEV